MVVNANLMAQNVIKSKCNQKWNKDKCRCKCKNLIKHGLRKKKQIWNPSISTWEWWIFRKYYFGLEYFRKCDKTTTMTLIFWDFFIFYQIFLSPQVKRIVIICNKDFIYDLPHELPNNLRLTILGTYEISQKAQNFIEW